jgi:hypothetical protein
MWKLGTSTKKIGERMKKDPPLVTSHGEGAVEKLWISELGYLMMKVYYEKESRWINYNLGKYDPEKNLFTEFIKQQSL